MGSALGGVLDHSSELWSEWYACTLLSGESSAHRRTLGTGPYLGDP